MSFSITTPFVTPSAILKQTRTFVRQRPLISAAYVVGLLVAVFFRGFAADADAALSYDRLARRASQIPVHSKRAEVLAAEDAAYRARGWFSCDRTCEKLERRAQELRNELELLEVRKSQTLTEAKQEIGLWTSIGGVAEIRS
ncbi:MAG: hypothetical protein EBZ48_16290, partial [Proteobacteria bacterium]|nr:hypothetical protein [Pseudomonadota bacterium]